MGTKELNIKNKLKLPDKILFLELTFYLICNFFKDTIFFDFG